jgi:perosamine synthetase
MLRDHAMSPTRRYWHEELGYNYRITNLQAALGCAQLDRAQELLDARIAIFEMYEAQLADVPRVRLNRTANWALNSYWMVCAELDELAPESRARLMAALKARGVDSRPYFYPMSDMPYLAQAATPAAHRVSAIGINLPTYVGLAEEDVAYIATQLRDCVEELGARA